ncbi:MAG: IS5 family transposase [Burkholderiaceae bacterium]|jgi:IS5 family transposase|nr:IS5 family transposase [Burkholderiaceae bacterium]
MNQSSFSDIEYSLRKRVTKREAFLKAMDEFIPWDEWVAYIEPYYPGGQRGRPPLGIEKMLRMYLLQCWFNLSDEGIEDAIYDSYALRSFMKINFVDEQVPDATTLLKFRHLLEEHDIGKVFFHAIVATLERCGYMMRGGTIVDATLIRAPSSTKNAGKQRDPEMCQTKKGNEYYFGMKCHIGVDAGSGYVHSLETTPANTHDITVASRLIREDDEVVYGDSGYTGIEKREEIRSSPHLSAKAYRINRRPKSVQRMPQGCIEWEKEIERRKSSVRSKVEHPFLIIKRYFGFARTVYRGLAKNTHRLYTLFACSNVLMCARACRSLRPA